MRGEVVLALAGLGALSALAAGCPGEPSCPEGSVPAGGRCVVEADASMGEDAPGGDACALRSFFSDGDEDGFGAGEPVEACEPPAGTVERGGECDDGDGAVYPGADETCDGVDEDCDGEADEGLAPPLGTPRMLDADPSLGIGAASVAVFGAGYAVAYAVGGKVYVAGVAEDGSPASAPVAVDSDGDTQEKPALAATAEGGLVVVWQRPVGGGAALVRARRLDASFGGPAAQTVTSSAADTGGAGPAVASVDGLVVVAWARADRAGFDGQVLREADLSPTGAAVSLMDARLDLGPPAALVLIPVAEPRPPHVLMAVAAPAASASSRPARVARLRVRPLATDGAAAVLDDGPATGLSGALGAAADGSARAVFTLSRGRAEAALVRLAPGEVGGSFGVPASESVALPAEAAPGATATSVLPDGAVDALLTTGIGDGLWWTRIARGEALVAEPLGPGSSVQVVSAARRGPESALAATATEEGALWLLPMGCVR